MGFKTLQQQKASVKDYNTKLKFSDIFNSASKCKLTFIALQFTWEKTLNSCYYLYPSHSWRKEGLKSETLSGAWGKENFINCGRQMGRGRKEAFFSDSKSFSWLPPPPLGEGEQIEPPSVNVQAGIGLVTFKAIQIQRVLSQFATRVGLIPVPKAWEWILFSSFWRGRYVSFAPQLIHFMNKIWIWSKRIMTRNPNFW